MSGPEHYLEAERLLDMAREVYAELDTASTAKEKAEALMLSAPAMANLMAQAQAHATLAVAAASAGPRISNGTIGHRWTEVSQ